MKSVFLKTDVTELIDRISHLTHNSKPLWGIMTVAQMLAHCNVSYEMVYTDLHPKPRAFMKFVLKLLVKDKVVGPQPYRQNGPTAPAFIIKYDKDFATEKKRLIDHLNQTLQLGSAHFDNKESHSFGKLSVDEWDTMFYKHLDHHLSQFGV